VIFGFSTLLLIGNYIISAVANDLGISLEHGGPRTIATTLWWAAIAIYMLYVGLRLGKKYHSEKLLGSRVDGVTRDEGEVSFFETCSSLSSNSVSSILSAILFS